MDSEEEYREHLDILRKCIALGRSFDCRIIRGFTFWRKGHYKEHWQEIIDKFAEPLKILEAEDVVLGIENEPSTFLGTGGTVKRFIDALGSPYVKAVWDPANSMSEREEADKEVPYPDGYEVIKGDMVHMHIKDSAMDPEAGRRRAVAVGEGDIDYRGQFRALKEEGYEGFASLETHFRLKKALSRDKVDKPGGEAFSLDAEGASRICLENIKKILKEI
jgi:sugar phosphate isomerase/epimerase